VSVRSVEFDLVTKSEGNERFASKGGMFAKAHRIAKQRKAVLEALAKLGAAPAIWITPAGAAPSYTEPNRIELRCTRIAPGSLDVHDNLQVAFKGPIDAVAEWIGVKDNDPRLTVHRCEQEKSAGVSTQGACPVCLAAPQVPCNLTVPGKVQSGCHAARRTPWRVRIEVEDRTPGADRRVVLASEPVKAKGTRKAPKRPKATPAGDPGEEVAARLLVPCPTCISLPGEACRPLLGVTLVYGVHVTRARLAGIVPLGPNGAIFPTKASEGAPPRTRTGVRKMAARVAPPAQARLPLARCYTLLPWRPREAIHEPRVDGLSPPPSLAYKVPDEHRATWGRTVTLYRQARTAAGLGTITVYALKGR
jgi:hypothetical protein